MRLGRYSIVKKIATGGMAEIFLAKDPRRPQPVVIKRILPTHDDNEELLEMFVDEARIATRLQHPNIATVFELGQDNGAFFLVMEYVPGDDLRHIAERGIKTNDFLPRPYAVAAIARAARGFHYAHTQTDDAGRPLKIVHRDVSPQNLMISFAGEVKIVDFGIAKAANRISTTRTGQLKGKFGYMSPEQVTGRPLDNRSDIFALGTVLYEMTVVKRLFRGKNDIKTIGLVAKADVAPPGSVRPEYPAELEAIVMRALSQDPADRYPTMAAFQRELEGFLRHSGERIETADLAFYMRRLYPERADAARAAEASHTVLPSAADSGENPVDEDVTTLWHRGDADFLQNPDPTMISNGPPAALLAEQTTSAQRRTGPTGHEASAVAGSGSAAPTSLSENRFANSSGSSSNGGEMSNDNPIDNPFLAAKMQGAEGEEPDGAALDAAQQQAIDTAQQAAAEHARLVEQEQAIIGLQQQGETLTAEQYGQLVANYTAQAQALAQQGNALAYLEQLSPQEIAELKQQQEQLMHNAQQAQNAAQQLSSQQQAAQAQAAQAQAAQAQAAQAQAAQAQAAQAQAAQAQAPATAQGATGDGGFGGSDYADLDEDFEGEFDARRKKQRTTLILVVLGVLVIAAGAWFAIGGAAIFETVEDETEQLPEKEMGPPEWEELAMESVTIESNPPGARVVINGFPHEQVTPTTVDFVSDKANTVSLFLDGHYPLHQFVPYATHYEGTIKLDLEKMPEPVTVPEGQEPNPMDIAQNPMANLEVKTQNPDDDGAMVWVDGKQVGPSPITVKVARNATHHVMIDKEGKAPHVIVKTVLQPADQISVQLTEGVYEDRFAEVYVEPSPPTATVEFDGTPSDGRAALKYDKGELVRVGVVKDAYEPWQFTVHTTPAGNFTLMPILKKYPRGQAAVTWKLPEGVYWFPCIKSDPDPVCWEGDINLQKAVPAGKHKVRVFEQMGGRASDRRFAKNEPEIELEPNKAYVVELDFSTDNATLTVGEPTDWEPPEPGAMTEKEEKE